MLWPGKASKARNDRRIETFVALFYRVLRCLGSRLKSLTQRYKCFNASSAVACFACPARAHTVYYKPEFTVSSGVASLGRNLSSATTGCVFNPKL